MAGNVVGIYCVALEVKEQTVHERLFVLGICEDNGH